MEMIKQQTKSFLFCSLIQSHNHMPQSFLSLFYQIPHRGARDCGETKFPPKQLPTALTQSIEINKRFKDITATRIHMNAHT